MSNPKENNKEQEIVPIGEEKIQENPKLFAKLSILQFNTTKPKFSNAQLQNKIKNNKT